MSAKTDMEAKDMYYEALEVRQALACSRVVSWSFTIDAVTGPCVPGACSPVFHSERARRMTRQFLPQSLCTSHLMTLLEYLEIRVMLASHFTVAKPKLEKMKSFV